MFLSSYLSQNHMPKEKKIIIIEDDEFLGDIYLTELSREGVKTMIFHEGEKGYQAVINEKPDLVILDILLPKTDGYAILKRIRENTLTRKTPVILLTNLSSKADVKKGLSLGANDFLIKAHFTPTEVLRIVDKYLGVEADPPASLSRSIAGRLR